MIFIRIITKVTYSIIYNLFQTNFRFVDEYFYDFSFKAIMYVMFSTDEYLAKNKGTDKNTILVDVILILNQITFITNVSGF